MHIDVIGHGPALVLLHGWALHGGVFAPLVERLAPHYQLHLVDLPGHGFSRDDSTPLALPYVVAEIAAATPPAVWLGWSLGGLFALHAAATLPQVRGLAMIAATPRFVRGSDWPSAVQREVFVQFGVELSRDYRGTLERFLALDTLGSAHARSELRSLRETLTARGEPAPEALQQGLTLLERTDLRRAVPQLARPSLWIAGQRDRLVPAAGMHAAAALSPHAQALTIAGGGHAPFLGHADQVSEALQRFVASVP
ncbi:pimeloyl-[acyl-carrier protein] methyl ester esterase [Xanthomonas citri pv. fuscans CFBP 6996]|uniref:Pimeloyl-[acyl-carrier protein] methyl ester esterase n=3 Tax=Xanthomonas citri TaxID=346 RepID=A0AB33CKC9_XANCI|nr:MULTISPECIES: pimeloyl-ACP methyl ester esterase BioH [Xanthomonas]MBO9746439.1 pimeloyl-ACP methyl ester esterase BioH [Xanthomonas phaseoli pv. dieffenbachiae]MBV6783391.1 pimeloyl-ACP methyl ester esterase BioH [Xanthomonas campestris pv. trichodesmae]MBV6836943.1 pimeloyl-ACP methyl ester esterase BioH [Xanthomonas campestris pv. merremiae]ASK93970.1 pimeloyl-[acyl-carrier protein] methyl ester esterase [Xanthomonas citri pv. vignicola]ASK95222.1 pimeloyl-[acyl-carrier protein] methyl e